VLKSTTNKPDHNAPSREGPTNSTCRLSRVQRRLLKPLVLLYLHTGLRLRELAELQREKVKFSDNEDEREITVLGKRKKWREVPLNDTAYEVLKELRAKSDGKGRVFPEWSAAGISRQYRGVALAESYLREPRSTSSAVRSIRTGASLRIEPETNCQRREAFRIPIPDWEPR